MAAKFQVLRDADGKYRFQLKSARGKVLAESPTFDSAAKARQGMLAFQTAAAQAKVPPDIHGWIIMNYLDQPVE